MINILHLMLNNI